MSTIVSRKPSMLPHSSRITSSTQSPSTDKTIAQNSSVTDQLDNNRLIVSSFLFKRSSKTHQWKKKWVVLRNCQLSYYKDSTEHKPNKVISSNNLQSFSKIPDHQKYHFAIYTNNKVLHFKTGDKVVYKKWIVALESFFKEEDDESSNKTEVKPITESSTTIQKPIQPEISQEVSHNSGSTQEQSELAEDGSIDEDVEAEVDVDNAEDEEAEEDDQASSSKSQNLVSVSSSWFHHSYNINTSRHSLPVSVKRTNSYTDEYSGPEDPYLSSGVSDSQMNQDSPTFAPSPFVLENPIKEEVEEEDKIELLPQVDANIVEATTTLKKLDISEPAAAKHESHNTQKRTSIQSLPDENEEECLIERGYLLRLRKRYNQWKRFYIVLTNKNMYFYKSESIHQVYKVIPISQLIDVIELDPLSKSKQWCLLIITPLKRVRFSARSEEEMIKWLSALKALVMKRNMSKRK